MTSLGIIPSEQIEKNILTLRGYRIMMDSDLAVLCGVSTKVLNQAVKRNIERFPDDFMFQLTADEITGLRSQFVTSKGKGGRRYAPFVFTEHGVAMLSGVLKSPRAIDGAVGRTAKAKNRLPHRRAKAKYPEFAIEQIKP